MDKIKLTGEFTREQLEQALKEFDKKPMLMTDGDCQYIAFGDGGAGIIVKGTREKDYHKQGRAFRTREDAELFLKAERFRTKCLFAAQQSWLDAGIEFDWDDYEQRKYFPRVNYDINKWKSDWYSATQHSPYIFATAESCEQFINDNKDDMDLLFIY